MTTRAKALPPSGETGTDGRCRGNTFRSRHESVFVIPRPAFRRRDHGSRRDRRARPAGRQARAAGCHESSAGAGPSLGPNLVGIGGRKAGGAADYDYSAALKASATIWSAETLAAFISDPNKAVPGNKMDYPGSDPAVAKTIADYLMTLK